MKILFVTENMPVPPIAGSSQRTAILLRNLADFAEVDIFLLRSRQEKEFLRQSGYTVAGNYDINSNKSFFNNILRVIFPLRDYSSDPELVDTLRQVFTEGHYDLLIGRYVRPSLRSGLSSIGPAIIDVDDIDISALKNRLVSEHTSLFLKIILKYRLWVLEKNFTSLLKLYKCLFLASEQDLPLIMHGNKHVVPNISYNVSAASDISESNSDTVLWVGSFNHRVNLEGLDSFISNNWPKVVSRYPKAVLRIVGSHLPDDMAQKWRAIKNVDITGYVEKLEDEYKNSAFSIVPLWDGAGTKIKVLESLMFKRTALVTTHAARGFGILQESNSLLVAESNEDFVNKLILLLTNTSMRREMETNGFNLVQQHYSNTTVNRAIKSALDSL